ncbi:MAG: hypothetical protein ACRDKB_13895 [Actinomycetota bacterium]
MAVITESRGAAVVTLLVAVVVVLALGAALVVTQWDKWTCAPPDGVWVEAADNCMELP